MKNELDLLVHRLAVGRLETSAVLSYIDKQMNAGIWSDIFLEMLEHDPRAGIDYLFEHYLAEKNIKVPTLEQSLHPLITYHLQLIISEAVIPYEQFGKLLQDIDSYDYHSKTINYVGDNIGISSLYGWYHNDFSSVEEINSAIIKESKVWLSEFSNCSQFPIS